MKLKNLLSLLCFSLFSTTMLFGQMIILSGPEKASYHRFVDDMIMATTADGLMIDSTTAMFENVATNGAAYNFDQLTDPNTPVKMVMMQSDYLYYQQMLDSKNNTEKTAPLSVLLPLADEEIHVVIRDEGRINEMEDLAKKVVACGTESQGTYATSILMKDRSRIFWNTNVLHFDAAFKDLMGRKIDAFIIVGSAPLELLNINPQSMAQQISLLSLKNVNDWAKYYTPKTIKAGTYKWLEKDVDTYAVRTVLVVNESKLTDEDKAMIDSFNNSVKLHYSDMVEKGHPKWSEVNFADWDESNWRVYQNK